jgi:S-adenosylmethionine decarboxylase
MNVGTEWLVDAEGCSAELLRNVETVRSLCEEVIADLGLRVVGEPMWHQFPQPGGVTGLYLLTESHLACHTFPETGLECAEEGVRLDFDAIRLLVRRTREWQETQA